MEKSTVNENNRFARVRLALALAAMALPAPLTAGAFGRVVSIGGHAADLALDEARGVLYVANFTANRIEVMSPDDGAIQTSINVNPQPGALAISPDGRWLLVAHYGNFAPPNTASNALTLINLDTRGKQSFALGFPPLGVAFGIDNRALVVTSTDFTLFDPVSGATQTLDTITGVVAKSLPAEAAQIPANIIAASVAASGDRRRIFGLTDTIQFSYEVFGHRLTAFNYVSTPPMGPRVVSVNRDGSYYLSGWALNTAGGTLWAQFPNPRGDLHIGSHAVDAERGLVYAQIPQGGSSPGTATPPVLQVHEADNLRVRERLQLAENLSGKSILSSDGAVMYAISDSGVTILPVGQLDRQPRVVATVQDVVFRGNFCDRRVATQEFRIQDPSGANTEFTLTSTLPGVFVSPSSGVTPAVVRVSVDPNAFQNQKGTASGAIRIASSRAVNLPPDIRVLVNNREPDQRGTFVNVPGRLVDILADPVRDRFFVLRQDTNEVLVFDGASYSQIASLRTGNTPTSMTVTFDRRWLLVGNDNSQIANVFDLETLEPSQPIRMPFGHYPRWLASSGNALLAASRVAGPVHKIDRIDMLTRTAVELPSLGVWENDIDINTALTASPNGSSILIAQANGTLMLYNANVDSFTVSRKDAQSLEGAIAASSFDQYVVGNSLLNSSLVPQRKLESGTGQSSGFFFLDQTGYRTTSPNAASPGIIQRVELNTGQGIRPTRMVESPILKEAGASFTRTLAPVYSRNVIVSLTTSGFTVLPWSYDASVAPPRIDRVVNAADGRSPLSPGGLITVTGRDLSPINQASRELPLPTALGESCLTVNGVPVPILFVSPSQVNAQMPFNVEGNVTMILRTPGGVSDNFNLTVLPTGPGVFHSGSAGPLTDLPTVIRARNGEFVTLSNPVHREDTLTIFLTGLGRTLPPVDAGVPAPGDPAPVPLIEPEVTLGGVGLPITFAGLAPGLVGVYQINVNVPGWVPLGMDQPLAIKAGGQSTVLGVRVVN
jgi:uncharacterized protein (TIGR03437 family)